jgi:hypothetical protein
MRRIFKWSCRQPSFSDLLFQESTIFDILSYYGIERLTNPRKGELSMATVSENSKALGTSVGTGSHLIKVPLCFQETEYTCGVACVQSVLAGYGIVYRQDVLADILKTRPVYGTDYQNILRFLQMLGFQAAFHYDMNIEWCYSDAYDTGLEG